MWGAGSTYEWQIGSVTGQAGIDWDLFRVTGLLDMSGLSSTTKMNLTLLADGGGAMNLSAGYEWTFAQAGSFAGLSNLTVGTDISSLFHLTAVGLDVGSDPANIKVLVGGQSNGLTSLNVWAVPEPSSQSLLAFGMIALMAVRSMRRKQS